MHNMQKLENCRKINLIEKTHYHSTSRNEVAGDSAENLKIQGLINSNVVSQYTLQITRRIR